MTGSMVSLDASKIRGNVMVGVFMYSTPMMWYNASWLIAAGEVCLNLGNGLCLNGCCMTMWTFSSSWAMLGIAALYPLGEAW